MNSAVKYTTVRFLSITLFAFGIFLLVLNLFGLTQSLRPDDIQTEHLRFKENDIVISPDQFKSQISKRPNESDADYAQRLTNVIAQGLAHIHWLRYEPGLFNQRVPIWENYILWMMGILQITPEYTRYHFSDVEKSIERGIGICGDASMIMSQLLEREGITNQIITIPGHVMVEADINGTKQLFDPDFGVVLQNSVSHYVENPEAIGSSYSDQGHYAVDDQFIINGFNHGAARWNGVKHFITKKYYFEKISYLIIWLLPLFSICLSYWLSRRFR